MRNLKRLTRAGAGVVLLLALVALLRQPSTKAAIKTAPPARAYYLTKSTAGFDGSQALNACATGYHMASFWEIHETSVLKYDTSLGLTLDDSGSGPPGGEGWVRTGGGSYSASPAAGFANCNSWTTASNSPAAYGTSILLSAQWNIPAGTTTPWFPGVHICSTQLQVWCVQD